MPLRSVVGHGSLVRLLRQAVSHQRVPQSLLLAGPEGVGKRTVALALAQAVNCPAQEDGDACGTCSTCQRIARGIHSDVTLVDRGDEASIKIRTLRERVLEQVGYRPFEARYRVFIIDPADDLTREAQDALLKTLEEPPPAVILILVTAYPDTLAATILSRCRRLRFGPLDETDVARVLESRGIAAADARRMAAASGGSVTRALAVETGRFEADREAALGLLSAGRSPGVSTRLAAAATLAAYEGKRRAREALASRLAILQSLLRDVGVMRTSGTASLANADLEDDLRALAPAFDVDRVIGAFAAVRQAEDALERNASPKIVADWLAVTI